MLTADPVRIFAVVRAANVLLFRHGTAAACAGIVAFYAPLLAKRVVVPPAAYAGSLR
jgi:hypothetical protein